VADSGPVFDGGDVDDPDTQDEAVEGEVGEGGQPGCPQGSRHASEHTKHILRLKGCYSNTSDVQ
jgi:hypothetical protein